MMGRQPDAQQKLIYTCLNLEKRSRKDHILRKIAKLIDFDFIYKQVEDKYGVITASDVSPGEKNEAHLLSPLIDQHQTNTGQTVTTAVADSKYRHH